MEKRSKKKADKLIKGSISILLAFLLTGVLSLGALLVEASRYQDAKKQLEEATINSSLSLLAFADSDLSGRFGLYGIDSESKNLSQDTFSEYLCFNSDCTEEGVYSANNISKLYNVTSGKYELKYDLANYQVLKRQILEYEKYRGPLNMTTDMLDVDKMIEKLIENIEKAIPALESLLEICDSVAELAEAIKALYCLYKDVQQLQLTINEGDADNLGEYLNEGLGKGWEAVEGLFSDEEWPTHDPSYIEAYNALKDAINDKVDYMKNNPPPQEPGPKPTADVDGLYSKYTTAKTTYETADLMLRTLETAVKLGYVNVLGSVDPSAKISDITDEDLTEEELKKFNLTKNSTRRQLLDAVNNRVASILGQDAKISVYSLKEVQSLINALNTKVPSLQSDMNKKYKTYSDAKGKLDQWNEKNRAFEEYNQNLKDYNTDIESKKSKLLELIDVVAGELNDYLESMSKVTSAIDKAGEAIETLYENSKDKASTDELNTILSDIKALIVSEVTDHTYEGLDFLNSQRDKLEKLKAEEIGKNYSFSSNFNTGDLLGNSSYYMSKSELVPFLTLLGGFDLLQKAAETTKIINAMTTLIKVIQPFPSTYSWDCNVKLNSSTTSILPSRINGGSGTTEVGNTDDIAQIQAMVDEARELLGSKYQTDLNAVDPGLRAEEAELADGVTNALTRLGTNLNTLVTNSTVTGLLGGTVFYLIATIFSLLEIIPTLVQICQDLIYIAQNIKVAFPLMLSSLGQGILINQYAIEKFPNRVNEVSGADGYPRTYFPDNNRDVQTFSGAQVEYIIGGSYNEKDNQVLCYWAIFVIRALNNIFAILADTDVMDIISSCSYFAPLVFIVWLYLETNIDMNKMLSDIEVPLVKLEIILSPGTLIDNLEDLEKAFEKVDEEAAKDDGKSYAKIQATSTVKELLKTDGLIEMEYKDYLWFFMFIVPNQTKVMRIADLVQMEMRYKKYHNGTTFLLQNVHTYARCEAKGSFNSILPVISLSDNSLNGRGIEVECVKYVGY